MSDLTQIERRLDRLEAMTDRSEDDFEDRRLGEGDIARRYGVTPLTIKNWRKDPRKHFPAAEIDPSGRRYNWLSQLRQYDRERRKAQEV